MPGDNDQAVPAIDLVALRVGVGRGVSRETVDRAADFLRDATMHPRYMEYRGSLCLWEVLDKDDDWGSSYAELLTSG